MTSCLGTSMEWYSQFINIINNNYFIIIVVVKKVGVLCAIYGGLALVISESQARCRHWLVVKFGVK
jgi:predicted ABC-type exoprotein transport system permease subunit